MSVAMRTAPSFSTMQTFPRLKASPGRVRPSLSTLSLHSLGSSPALYPSPLDRGVGGSSCILGPSQLYQEYQASTVSLAGSDLSDYVALLERRIQEASVNCHYLNLASQAQAVRSEYDVLGISRAVQLYCSVYDMRKADLRELKLLQKVENKQYQDLMAKASYLREQQEKKFEQEMQVLLRNYEVDIETMNRQQKQAVEKEEATQGLDMRVHGKKLRQDQERELKAFHEGLKQELKLLKQEVDMLPKDQRKEALRRRREEKGIEQQEKERKFLEQQQEGMEKAMKRLADQHREKVALLERQFMESKQQLLRAREAAIWELEERHLQEKHQLAKRQLKDLFFLKRHQMLTRHEKEIDQTKRVNTRKEVELLQRHQLEKKRLPKIQKTEMKTRAQMFKQSLRISGIMTPEQERDKIRQFEDAEKKRAKAEQLRQDLKHRKQWDDLQAQNEAALKELEQLQSEKRKMLMDHETQKMKELEEAYQSELQDWRQMLRPRKQALEEEFQRQLKEQERFYSGALEPGSPARGSTYTAESLGRGSKSSRMSTVM